MQPKISVIVPVYKAEKYLHRCVDSILAQTFTDFELILVNDGSPDNSGAICDEYAQKDSRVRVFHKENGGVSSARNLGLDNAKGDWITFVDSDDYIENGFLDIPDSAQEDLLIQNYKVIEGASYDMKFENSIIPQTQIQEFINNNINKQWLRVPWGKFFKNEIIVNNSIIFPKGINIGEDTIFILEYLYYTRSVMFLGTANYIYKDDIHWANRYVLSVEKAIETFHYFIEKYNKLNANSFPFLHFAFSFYWGLTSPKDYNSVNKWKKDKTIKLIYKKIRHTFNLKWRIKYFFYLQYTILKKIHGK